MSGGAEKAYVDFCGEHFDIDPSGVTTIGRDATITIDDNPYLHRRLLEITALEGLFWVTNTGSILAVTLSDASGLTQSWLAPGARLPLVFPRTCIWFTAGPTTYELEVVIPAPPYEPAMSASPVVGDTTVGRVTLTPDQRLLIVGMAEDILKRGNRGVGAVPPSAAAAARLGWTLTKFNRKLDNVCEKLANQGAKGLVSGQRAASNRRARLVEYALATRLITVDDLPLLDVNTGEAQFH